MQEGDQKSSENSSSSADNAISGQTTNDRSANQSLPQQQDETSQSNKATQAQPNTGQIQQPLATTEIQTPTTDSTGTQAVLEQVTATANAARQRFSEKLTQGTAAIATKVQQQQQAIQAAGDNQTEALRNIFAGARQQVAQMVTNAQQQLQAEVANQEAALEQSHTANLSKTETTFTTRQEQAQNLGDTQAEKVLETAENSAQKVQSQIQGSAQEARNIGQDKAQTGGSTPEVAQAKAKLLEI